MVPGVRRLVTGKVVGLWVSLLMDIAFVLTLVSLLGVVFAHVEPLSLLSCARARTLSVCLSQARAGSKTGYVPTGTFQIDNFGYGEFVLAFVLIIACKYAATVLAAHFGNRAAQLVKLALREQLYRKMLRLGPSYAQRVRTSDVVQSAGEGIEQIQSFFEQFLPQLVFAVIAPLTLFFALLPVNALAAVVLLVCAPLIVVITALVSKRAARVFGTYWGKYTDMGAAFLDNLQGLETLKTFDADERAASAMNTKSEQFRVATMRVLQIQLRSLTAMDVVAYGGAAAGILTAVWQFASGRIWLPDAMIIVMLSISFFLPLRQLGSYSHVAMNGMTSSRRIFALLDAPEPRHGQAIMPADADAVSIAFDHVGYTYDAQSSRSETPRNQQAPHRMDVGSDADGAAGSGAQPTKALDDVSFTARSGSLTAIVGVSGSGKSTATAVVAGELGGYTGSVRLHYRGLTGPGEVELGDLSQASLISLVTLVTTQSYLLAGTLRENLTMARPDATENELWIALKRARIDGFVYRQPKGLDMRIEQGASNLSGGQRQRLCIARALLHDTPVYVFDEATSSVDARSEALIVTTIRELAENHTVLMVAHRLADAVHADHIVVMDRGRVAQTGVHETLLQAGGIYADMFREQQSLEQVGGRRTHRSGSTSAAAGPHAAASPALSYMDAIPTVVASAGESAVTGESAAAKSASGRSAAASQSSAGSSNKSQSSAGSSTAESSTARSSTAERRRRERSSGSFSLIRRLLGMVGRLTPYMVQACLYGVIGHLAAALIPLSAVFALFAQLGRPIWGVGVGPAVVVMVVCALLRGLMRYAEQFMNHNVAFRLLALFRAKVFAALRRLAPAKLVGKGKGDLIALVTTDVELLEIFFAHTISPLVIAVVTTVVFAVALGFMNPWFAVLLVAAHLLVGVVLPRLLAWYVHKIGPSLRERSSALDDAMLDDMRGLREIIRYGSGQQRLHNIVERTKGLHALQSKLSRRTSRFSGFADMLVMLATVIAGVLVLVLGQRDPSRIPSYIAAVTLISSSFGPVLALSALPSNLTQTFASARRLFALIDESPAVEESGTLTPGYHGMSLQQVDFAYDQPASAIGVPATAHRVLNRYSLTIPQLGIVGIQGHSGRGKSTILRLLMRYWDPQGGAVTFSGVPLPSVDASHRRQSQTMMSQETYLFDGTIRENLVIAKPEAGGDDLREALRHASALELVEGLPEGLDTQVGELGGRLSEGERQRLGLARMFLRDARLALFDEPTSRVDALNEAVMLRSIAELADRNTAVVLVSHRPQAMRIADTVVQM